MHRTCTNNPVKSDRRKWLIHREVQFEVCFLRPCSEEGSDATKTVKKIPDCDNSAEHRNWQLDGVEVLGLSLFPFLKIGRYAWLIRPCITRETRVSSLVVDSGPCYHPLHTWQENCWTKHKTNRRKFYICADGPHTHTLDHGVPRKKAGGRRCTEAFTHRGFYTEKPLDRGAFYAQKVLRREVFTLRSFCTRTSWSF